MTQKGSTECNILQLNMPSHPQSFYNYSFYVKALQRYHLKQYFTAVKSDLCNNDSNGEMKSSKEVLSHISMANNFIKTKILMCCVNTILPPKIPNPISSSKGCIKDVMKLM